MVCFRLITKDPSWVWFEKSRIGILTIQLQVQVVYSRLHESSDKTQLNTSKQVCVFLCRLVSAPQKFLHMYMNIYESTSYLPKHWPFSMIDWCCFYYRINESTPPHESSILLRVKWGTDCPALTLFISSFKRVNKDSFQSRRYLSFPFSPPPPPPPCDSPFRAGLTCVCDPASTRDCSGFCRRCAYPQFPTRLRLALVEVRTASAPSFLSISSCLILSHFFFLIL